MRIHPSDNVLVALRELHAGDLLDGVIVEDEVPGGHKVAAAHIATGQPVIKYGQPIGVATREINPGQHVHTHNLASALNDNWSSVRHKASTLAMTAEKPMFFDGYRRADGKVGTRNEVWIIPSVGCVNQASIKIAEQANAKFPADERFDGVYAYPHPFGCSQLGDDLEHTRKVLAGLIRHPNAAAVLVMGLGCENNQIKELLADFGPSERLRYFNAQEVPDEIEAGLSAVSEMINIARKFQREQVPVKELILAMKCGGSDGLSGITANPLVGRIANWLSAQGGTVLLSEVPEMFGAEQILMDRADSDATASAVVDLVNDFRTYFRRYNQPIDENPSPGNKAGGLSTNADKSLGCLQKAGDAPIRRVLRYGEPVDIGGLAGVALVNAPGNDGVSSTAMTVAGAQMILFTTGRGTPMGFPVPTLKIATNSDLAARKPAWIDFNAGQLLEGASMEKLTSDLLTTVLETASGKRKARNEINGNREIAIWKDGVTL